MKVVAVESDDGSCLRADVNSDQDGDYAVEIDMIAPDGEVKAKATLSAQEARFFGRALLSLHDPAFLEAGI